MTKRSGIWAAGAFASLLASSALAQTVDPDQRAQQTLAQMTQDEKLELLTTLLTARLAPADKPANAPNTTGYTAGVPRLGVPPIIEADGGLGIANMGGFMRPKDGATAMPSGTAMASTWNTALVEEAGRVMGAETRAKGINVILAGSINLIREPRGGRNFEYFSEDPLLSGLLGGYSVRGIQSQRVVSTLKHYLLNNQETGRQFANVIMDEGAMRESDLLAFQIAIEVGNPGSIMCSYNKVNGVYACENSFILNDVLRRDWNYKGWVMSDWGAVHSVSIREGLDQESGRGKGGQGWFAAKLRTALTAGTVNQADVDRSALRILRTMYALGLVDGPVKMGQPIDYAANGRVAQRVAENGIVLLKNEGNILPIAATAKRILLIGAHADKGVPSGGGSSQVWPAGGASLSLAIPGDVVYHRRLYMPSAPLDGLKEELPQATISYDDGTDLARAAAAAKQADLAIVFAEQFMAENIDAPTLNLPDNQDALIDAVASANKRTVVVLETNSPMVMPWLAKVPAVLQAWYAGQRGGHAIARVLTGAVNPSGKLPITFPASLAQTPNPVLPGQEMIDEARGRDVYVVPDTGKPLDIRYPEGSNVGYRWYAAKGYKPLFAFGHGLSYTSFAMSALQMKGTQAQFSVRNNGKRAGATVAQLYLTGRDDKTVRRLVGFQRVELAPGESRTLSIDIDPRLLADWKDGKWSIPAARYSFALGEDAEKLGKPVAQSMTARNWGP